MASIATASRGKNFGRAKWLLKTFAGRSVKSATVSAGRQSESEFEALSASMPTALPKVVVPKDDLTGSQDSLEVGFGTSLVDEMLDLPDHPIRPFEGAIETSRMLMEMALWSREASDLGRYVARDTFMTEDGSSGSWYVPDKDQYGNATPPDILAIARDLSTRMQGKEYILGGSALNAAAAESAVFAGDSFLSLGLVTEGLNRNDYGIARSLRLPVFSVFVDKGPQGVLKGYWQRARLSASPADIFVQPQNMLHFQANRRKRYGMPLMMQSIPSWRRLKRAAPRVEKAMMEASVAPWLHEMPDGQGEPYRQNYKRTHQTELRRGMVTHLYLASGADVRQAKGGGQDLEDILNYWVGLRRAMIPAGFPNYLFPQLNAQTSGSKDLANQPAQTYARTIAASRASQAEEIEHALRLEITLKRGYEYMQVNHRFIRAVWPAWTTVPISDSAHTGKGEKESNEDSRAESPDAPESDID